MAKTTTAAGKVPASEASTSATSIYEVTVDQVKIGGVTAYRTARVNLTSAQADALNAAQPGTVKFLGI